MESGDTQVMAAGGAGSDGVGGRGPSDPGSVAQAATAAAGVLGPGADVGGYSVASLLGKGAMGAVYEAVDGGGERVALKVLHAHMDNAPAGRQRLRREVAALQRLRHPAVAQVLDAEFEGPYAFVVTELVDGPTLEDEVDARGPLELADLFSLADQLADALESVHAAGVVHRDLKPSNVMVTAQGPSLIDFGIAHSPGDARTTQTGFVMGTPGYIAPELLDGGAPAPETDWWSWAALLAFAATGRSPFGVRPTDVVLRRSREGRADLVGVPARTARALAGALHADPARRWGPTEVVRAIRRDLDDGGAVVLGLEPDPQATQRIVVAPGASTEVIGYAQGSPGAAATTAGSADDEPGTPATDSPDSTAVLGPPVAAASGDDTEVMGAVERQRATARDGATHAVPMGDARYLAYDDIDEPEPPAPSAAPAARAGGPYTAPRHPRRWGTVLALGLPFVVLAAVYPLVAFGIFCGVTMLCRIVGTAGTRLHERRESRGVRRSDPWVATLLFPYHAAVGALGVIPAALVGGCVGLLAMILGWWVFGDGNLIVMPMSDVEARSVGGRNEPVVFGALLVVVMALAMLATWFGPAGRTARTGARMILANLAPGLVGALVVVVVCVAGAWLLAGQVVPEPFEIRWWPMDGPPAIL